MVKDAKLQASIKYIKWYLYDSQEMLWWPQSKASLRLEEYVARDSANSKFLDVFKPFNQLGHDGSHPTYPGR